MSSEIGGTADEYTEVTSESWMSRIWGSIQGVLLGLLLFLVAFPLLFWNEGRAVKRARSLEEGAKAVVSVEADEINPKHEGELVHVTGRAVTPDSLTDPVFGVTASALKMRRRVEMYQWIENESTRTEKQTGGSKKTVKTYSYKKRWKHELVNSDLFKRTSGHQNPSEMPYPDWSQTARPITVGAYRLPASLMQGVGDYDKYVPSSQEKATIEETWDLAADGGTFYSGTPGRPRVGDVRIRFSVVDPGPVSVIAKQTENTFEAYRTSNGGELEMVRSGTHSADAMFAEAQATNTMWTWILRGGGFLLMMGGLSLIFRPLSVVADVVPFIGSILETGLGIVSFLLAAPLTLVTIAVGWIYYRPMVAVGLLIAAAALVGVIVWLQTRGGSGSTAEGSADAASAAASESAP